MVGRWRDRLYAENDAAKMPQTRFLLEFDLDYRQRRLSFLLTKLDEAFALKDGTQPVWPAGVVKGAVDQPLSRHLPISAARSWN